MVSHAKQCIDQLIKRGTRVILLEIPMDPRIAATPHYSNIRAAMRAEFPEGTYPWISLNPELLEYSDGIHIAPEYQQKAGRLIDEAIASLGFYRELGFDAPEAEGTRRQRGSNKSETKQKTADSRF